MTHLSPQQFVDAIEHTLDPAASAHLRSCAACRESVAALGPVASDVRGVDQPEPSPLFWAHFSARVRAATEVEAIPVSSWWRDGWKPLVAAGLAAAVMAFVVVVRHDMPLPVSGMATDATAAAHAAAAPSGGPDGPDGNSAALQPWEAVTEAASGLPARDVQLVARPTTDTAAAAIADLSPAQQAELIRLLKVEMARTGRSE